MKRTAIDDDYYGGSANSTGHKPARRKSGPTPEEQTRSRRFWREDGSELRARSNGETAVVAILKRTGIEPIWCLLNRRRQLRGLLNTETAWRARRAWVREGLRAHRAYRRAALLRGERAFRFMVVVVPARFRQAEGRLAELDIGRMRATARRRINRLPAGTLVTGMIEVVMAVDPGARPARAWTPHLNLIVELVAESRKAARQAIKDAFSPVKKDENAGVYVPVRSNRVWWLRGVLRYLSKGLQLHRIGQRKPYLDSSGERSTRKDPLTSENQVELVMWLEKIEARHLILPIGVI